MGLFGAGSPPCPEGSTCSGQSMTKVGRTYRQVRKNLRGGRSEVVTQAVNTGTDIYHSSASKINPDGSVTTDVYIIKDGKWQKAATTNDGGKNYTYDDNVAGAGLKKELSDPQGAIHKNVDANINKAAEREGLSQTDKNKLLDTNPNKADATEDGSADTQQSPAPSAPGADKGYESDARTDYQDILRYPLSLGETEQDQDYLKIQMVEYEPRGVNFQQSGGIPSRPGLTDGKSPRTVLSAIFLPIPSGIQDDNRVGWNKDEADPVKLAMADFANQTITGGVEGAKASLGNISATLKNNKGIKDAVSAQLTKNLTGVNVLGRKEGAVINSNIELLFSGPELRTFTFNFKLSPRDDFEAKEIQKIIRTLKQGMSAKKAADFLFVKSPHTFFLGYYKGAELQPFMNKFKECALTSMSVQYAPDGPFATYTDGSMTSYGMSLTFQELEPIFDNDYGEDYKNIGF